MRIFKTSRILKDSYSNDLFAKKEQVNSQAKTILVKAACSRCGKGSREDRRTVAQQHSRLKTALWMADALKGRCSR